MHVARAPEAESQLSSAGQARAHGRGKATDTLGLGRKTAR